MLASGPGCHHVDVTGKQYTGGSVLACVSLCGMKMNGSQTEQWRWRAEVFSDQSWERTYVIGERLTGDTRPPSFEHAIVPFSRAWSDIVSRTWRVSMWREYKRLAQGLDAYDEEWLDKINHGKFDGRMMRFLGGPDDNWPERDMQRWLSAMKQVWLKTPEGFFEARSKKNARG